MQRANDTDSKLGSTRLKSRSHQCRRMLGFLSFAIFLVFSFPHFSLAQNLSLPEPSGFVNDFVSLLKTQERLVLEETLRQFDRETSNEIVVAIVPNLQEITVEDFAVRLFEKWKIGEKKKDNGILLLISMEERKSRIEVGYGLEGAIPDGLAGEILDTQLIPEFRNGNYAEGIKKAVSFMMVKVKGEYVPDLSVEQGSPKTLADRLINFMGFLVFFVPIILSWFGSFLGRTKRIWPGGVIGAIGGSGIGFLLVNTLFFAIGGLIFFGLLGLFFDYVVSKNYVERKRRGLPTDFWHSGGGFWLGGGRGGGSGGGGFGGFGGGFSGGGGASRGW